MFKNPGNKLRMLSEVTFIIFAIASAGYGLFYMTEGEVLLGIFTIGIGVFVSYVIGLLLCAFGKLVENSEKLVKVNETEKQSKKQIEKQNEKQQVASSESQLTENEQKE